MRFRLILILRQLDILGWRRCRLLPLLLHVDFVGLSVLGIDGHGLLGTITFVSYLYGLVRLYVPVDLLLTNAIEVFS